MINEEINKNISAIMVIFGGTGDLTHRKLMPALYNLVFDGLLPENFAVVSIGRKNKTTQQYRDEVFESLNKYSRNKIDNQYWARLRDIIYYLQFDFTQQEGYAKLKDYLKELDEKYNTGGNRVFYLAVAPEYFELIVQGLSEHKLAHQSGAWTRLVLFSDTQRGAKASAIVYSIIESAKANQLNPYMYLVLLFTKLPNLKELTAESLKPFLPWSSELPGWCRNAPSSKAPQD